ncbi:MAG TPA: site-2 protease family protein [Pyrinomonadaceae bacterium]|nr:site-2 protease family protein [Pyrinomonadaceae bacterium]
MRPKLRTWFLHALLLLITFATATIAGVIYPFGKIPFAVPDPQTLAEVPALISALPLYYIGMLTEAVSSLVNKPDTLSDGLSFSLSLLFILLSHEMGHYVACRLYRVDATLPFFIPTPPLIGPAGTFGAFIKIKSPMPSRRAVFDIGVAGPIAGFLALLPIAAIGTATMETIPIGYVPEPGGITFTDPLLMHLIGGIFGKSPELGFGNPFYFAAWIGLLVTALNLIPSGQLDGGHAIYAVFGKRVHFFTGRIAFVIMTALAIVGFVYFGSPSGFLVAVLLGVMTRVRHPEPWDQTPLDAKRKLVAFITLVIFVLCFVPFAIRIN